MKTSIRELIREDQELYVVSASEDITREGFLSLASAGVYSVPVRDSRGVVIGMLDHADFCRFVLKIFTQKEGAEVANKMTVADVMNMSGRDALVTVPIESSSVGDVVDAMVKQQLHRLCVTSQSGQVEWLLSQLDVVNFFASRLSPTLAKTRLSELGRKSELGFLSQHTISID